MPHGKIAEVVNCCAKTVTNVLKLYEQTGIEGLYTLNYQGQPSQLNAYEALIKADLEASPVRTLAEAQTRIKKLTGLQRSQVQIGVFLKKLGFKRRRPQMQPAKANPDEQTNFKKKRLNRS